MVIFAIFGLFFLCCLFALCDYYLDTWTFWMPGLLELFVDYLGPLFALYGLLCGYFGILRYFHISILTGLFVAFDLLKAIFVFLFCLYQLWCFEASLCFFVLFRLFCITISRLFFLRNLVYLGCFDLRCIWLFSAIVRFEEWKRWSFVLWSQLMAFHMPSTVVLQAGMGQTDRQTDK